MKKTPRSRARLKYNRVLLKLSGEAFAGRGSAGLTEDALAYAKTEIEAIHSVGVETALVIGGGNFLRGSQAAFLPRVVADQMGMLATLMNGLALSEALSKAGIQTLLQSAVSVPWADSIRPARAKRALSNGEVVIFAGGTGNPFVTTDTAAAIRACEIDADVLLKATQVDGVYSADPKKYRTAKRYQSLGFAEAIKKNLAVMDLAAFDLCWRNHIPVVVFDFYAQHALKKIALGEMLGTLVC